MCTEGGDITQAQFNPGDNPDYTSVPFDAIIFNFFAKNGRANAVLSAIFYVLYSAELRKMPSSAIFLAITYVEKLR